MANELIYSAGVATNVPIGVSTIASMIKAQATDNLGVIDYQIVFHHPGGLRTAWHFSVEATRNTTFTNIQTQYGWDAD